MSIPGQQTVNVGLPNESANSDSLYTAFNKINQNFTNVFACASPYNTFTAGPGVSVNANATLGTVSITNTGVTNIIAGTNIVVNQSNGNVTISATGSGNGGGLSSVGLNPTSTSRLVVTNTPLVTNGNMTIDLAVSGVTQGTYNNPTLTVDNYGRITSAANGNIAGTVTSVGLVSGPGIQVSGGPVTSNGNITVTNTGVTRINAGSGIVLSGGNGNVTVSAASLGGTVTSVGLSSTQLVVSGSPVVSAGTINVELPNTANFSGNVNANRINANGGNINGNLIITGNISPAANNKVGGIKPGPGVDISLDGELTIDTANLPLSFGNFTANNNILSIVNVDEDMILSTDGNAEIQLVGNIGFYKPDGYPPNIANRYFYATTDGSVHSKYFDIQSFGDTGIAAPFNVTIDTTGNFRPPAVLNGAIAQFTGNTNTRSFIVQDTYGVDGTFGTGGQYVFRTGRGNVDTPAAIQNNDRLGEVTATGWASNGYGGQGSGFYRIVANENFTSTARGGRLELWVVPNGTITETKIATIDGNGLAVTGIANISGNANVGNLGTAGLITATGNVSGGNLTTVGIVSATGNVVAGNVYANSGTVGTTTASISGNATVGNLLSNGAITSNSATAGVGYRTGAGGTVTQLTDKTTAVTLNKITGEITMSNALLGGDSTVSFTLNNSTIANTDVIIINQVSTANRGEYSIDGACNSGNAVISVHNMTNTNRSDAIVLRYAVIKAAIA